METWKAAPGYEGRYDVSNLGRVRSLPRHRNPHLTMLKTPLAADGYPVVNLTDASGKRTVCKVHRLVLLAFEGTPPAGKPYALHRFGDRSDARLSGLYWGSPKENQDDREAHGTSNAGERNGQVVIAETQARSIKEQLNNRKRGDIAKVARELGLNYQTVRDIAAGKTWSHL